VPIILGWSKAGVKTRFSERFTENLKKCDVSCEFSDDHEYGFKSVYFNSFICFRKLSKADAVVFEPRFTQRANLPAHQNSRQYFVFASFESPLNEETRPALRKFPKQFFNISMTYRSDADVLYGYGKFDPISNPLEDIWSWKKVII
jgi:hypothetical protein